MTGFGGSVFIHTLVRFWVIALGGLAVSAISSIVTHADESTDLRPSWVDNYAVWSGRARLETPNHSYLQNTQMGLGLQENVIVDQMGSLFEGRRAQELRQQYEDINRNYEYRKNAGLTHALDEQGRNDEISRFRDGVVDEAQKKKLKETGDVALGAINKDQTARAILAPGAVVAGVWIGRPVRLKLNDDFQFKIRTSLRDRMGQIELHSPFVFGSFEFHPEAPDNYTLVSSTSVDFGRMLNLRGIPVDFASEKYQFVLARDLPLIDVSSSLIYGSSSNVLASSLTKQLTANLAASVDSVYYLSPYDPDHPLEERVRLRYDLHF